MGRTGRAAMLACLTACGSVAGRPDAQVIDADLNDADLTGTATVVTHTHTPGNGAIGAVQGMVALVALLPNGAVGDTTQSDASGNATIHVYPGGSVTAIYPHTIDLGADLVTFLGVAPGDTLDFGKTFAPATTTSLGAMTLAWPANATASEYRIFIPCGGYFFGSATTSFASFTEADNCDHVPMEVIGAVTDTAGALTGYSVSQVTFGAGGAAGLSGWATPVTASANITDLPPEVSSLSFSFNNIANGGIEAYQAFISGQPTAGAFTQTFPWDPIGDLTFGDLTLRRTGGFQAIDVFDGLHANSTNWTVAGPQLPPWHAGTVASAAAREILWFPIGPTSHDGDVVLATWTHVVNTVNTPFTWNFIAPPDTTMITLPMLPTAFADLEPHPEDLLNAQVHMVEIPTVTGYDAFRALPEQQLICLDCAVRAGQIARVIQSD